MAKVISSEIYSAPASQVWQAWDNFGDIQEFNPNLNASSLINGSKSTGLGAERRCDFSDGKNHILERIVSYNEGESMTVEIYSGTVPLKRATASIRVKSLGPNKTEVVFVIEFTPKFGPIGTLMTPLMKAQFRRAIGNLLAGSKEFVEKGVVVQRSALAVA